MPSIRTRELQLHALGAETTTGAGSAIDVRDMARLVVYLFVTAVTGTSPTLDVVVQDSPDGTTWTNLASFTQVTATGEQAARPVTPFGNYIRVAWTIAGTSPSFTFSCPAVARGE